MILPENSNLLAELYSDCVGNSSHLIHAFPLPVHICKCSFMMVAVFIFTPKRKAFPWGKVAEQSEVG
jgi:hypothetical protein